MFLVFFIVSLSNSLVFEKTAHNTTWKLVFYHNSAKGGYFSSHSEAAKSNTDYKYSIIGEIDEKYKINGTFEFLLEYPTLTGYNRWKQSISPILNQEVLGQAAIGYSPVSLTWSDSCWGGMVKSNDAQYTLLDGASKCGPEYWWYCIGALNDYLRPNFPGPSGISVPEAYLWVRIDKPQWTITRRDMSKLVPIMVLSFLIM